MKFFSFVKSKCLFLSINFFMYFVVLLLFFAFKVDISLIIAFTVLFISVNIVNLLIEYFSKRKFYNQLINNVDKLDKSYLVLETLKEPNFYEGKLLYNSLYEINKSMNENVMEFSRQVSDFKNYIEMWIHEVKIPLASCMLKLHNNRDKLNENMMLQLNRIDDYLEQVLYYVRSENASKDYFISKVNLEKCVNSVLVKNKDYLLDMDISLDVRNVDFEVYTDAKWFMFIINQILNNSIKYKSKNSIIKIYAIRNPSNVVLVIEDNGKGISLADLPRVFEKSFTGSNGRDNVKSTGMGLFIVKNLCDKLGHNIEIKSVQGEYTRVEISLSDNNFYDEVR